jgi:UDP-2,3-diacylglucosamine pyrophosphatase LpxH
VFISDIHLGFRGCSAAYLLDFLRSVETETLYLVGDIIDVWSLRKSFFWPQAHNDVIRTILGKAKHGTRVVYIPGNHDTCSATTTAWCSATSRFAARRSRDGRRPPPAGPARRRVRQRDQGEPAARSARQSRLLVRC